MVLGSPRLRAMIYFPTIINHKWSWTDEMAQDCLGLSAHCSHSHRDGFGAKGRKKGMDVGGTGGGEQVMDGLSNFYLTTKKSGQATEHPSDKQQCVICRVFLFKS